jgi:hypothetical protein
MRIARTLAGLVLVGGLATACGDDGGRGDATGAPDDASKDDFCQVIEELPGDGDPSQDDVDEWADKLADTGTPEDIDDDARHGFEVLVAAIEDTDVDDIGEDSTFDDVVKDADDRVDVSKFVAYFTSECSGLDLPTELPSDLPTELPTEGLPSDFPSEMTELPSEFPTDLLTIPSDFTT